MEARTARAALLLLALCGACTLANASHFRYGTLSWAPTGVSDDTGAQVEFTFKGAYRRNYNWGSYFGEQWLELGPSEPQGNKIFYGSELKYKTDVSTASLFASGFVDAGTAALRDCALKSDLEMKSCFDCPFCLDDSSRIPVASRGNPSVTENPVKVDCMASSAVRLDCQNATAAELDVAGGCTDYHGCRLSNPRFIPNTVSKLVIKFPPIKQNNNQDNVVPCASPFQCDFKKANETGPSPLFTEFDNKAAHDACKLFRDNPTMQPERCGSWDDIYGMFLGDDAGNTIDVAMDVTTIDETKNAITGNYLQGQAKFRHKYPYQRTFTAFFTGGYRLYECNYNPFLDVNDESNYKGLSPAGTCDDRLQVLLNNNAEGRFRLETEIYLEKDPLGRINSSPIASNLPVLPVPMSAVDGFAKFQIAAYDSDDDKLTFRFGNYREYGGITRSKSEVFPVASAQFPTTKWCELYKEKKLDTGEEDRLDKYYNCTGDGTEATYGMLPLNLANGQYGSGTCQWFSRSVFIDDYTGAERSGVCPSDRVPTNVTGTDYSFRAVMPGLVEWRTWHKDGVPCLPEYFADGTFDPSSCQPMTEGLYNMVVMITDSPADGRGVKVPLDFMLYLYDGPVRFCDGSCKDNKEYLPTDALGATVPYGPGTTHNSNQDNWVYTNDAAPGNNPGDTCATNLIGRSQCKYEPKYKGVETFTDRDGVYGMYAEFTVDGNTVRMSQACTICSAGKIAKNDACKPPDGVTNSTCGTFTLDSGNIVPADSACKMNSAPFFVSGPDIDGVPDTPYLSIFHGSKQYANKTVASMGSEQQAVNTWKENTPTITTFRGEDIMFYVTAADLDDCAELTLESTGLPHPPRVADGNQGGMRFMQIDGVTAGTTILTDDIKDPVTGKVTKFPEGMMVRRKFIWRAPKPNDPAADDPDMGCTATQPCPRPERSVVCFYAYDKYLITAQPFYCVTILIQPQPKKDEETLLRFDCKLALNWYPHKIGGRESNFNVIGNKFVLKDGVSLYMTEGDFDSYMWHHAMVTVNDAGDAHLVVDGVVQRLLKNVELDANDPNFGIGEYAGTSVNVRNFPNRCVQSSDPNFKVRRELWHENTAWFNEGTKMDNETSVDMKYGERVNNGYLTGYTSVNNSILAYDNLPNGGASTYTETECYGGKSCSFKMAVKCEDDSTQNFDGILDEIAVWNRPLSIDEIRAAMFKMSANKLLDSTVELDLPAGRVLWARFNNPCMEGPVPPPPAPAPVPTGGGRTRATSTPSERAAKAAQQLRRIGVTDDAAYTAGYIDATGTIQVVDELDSIAPIKFRENSSYIYTGVPWEAPLVTSVSGGAMAGDVLPVNGGTKITMKGIGFAPSPFLKCAVIEPQADCKRAIESSEDPEGVFNTYACSGGPDYDASDYNWGDYFSYLYGENLSVDGYKEWARLGMMIPPPGEAFAYHGSSANVIYKDATPMHEPNEMLPWFDPTSMRNPKNKAYSPACPWPAANISCPGVATNPSYPYTLGTTTRCAFCPMGERNDWDPTLNWKVREGLVPPYEKLPKRENTPQTPHLTQNFNDDYIYGSYETVVCDSSIPVNYPSDMFYAGVSNDGGLTGSPPHHVKFMDYALTLDGKTSLVADPKPAGFTFSMWFWPLPTTSADPGVLMELSGELGIYFKDNGVYVNLGGKPTPTRVENGTPVPDPIPVEPDMWHHIVVTVDGKLVMYLDGVSQDLVQFDGIPSLPNGYDLVSVGEGFVGHIDAVKVVKEAADADQAMDIGLSPFSAGLTSVASFTMDSMNASAPQSDMMLKDGSSVPTFTPLASPWHPTSIYSVASADVHEELTDKPPMGSTPLNGMEKTKVTGFNFAKSKYTKCEWGSYPFPGPNGVVPWMNEFSWETHRTIRGNETYGLNYAPYLAEYASRASPLMLQNSISGNVELASDTVAYCTGPTDASAPGAYEFSVTNPTTLNTQLFDLTEVALECDGVDDYSAAATGLAGELAGSAGYSFSLWVLPYENPVSRPVSPPPPPPPNPTTSTTTKIPEPQTTTSTTTRAIMVGGRRTMLQEMNDPLFDKLGRRRELAGNMVSETTVLAFEKTSGDIKNEALLMYDGERFFYYDDAILDVKSTSSAGATAGQWHFVMVTVGADGEGDLYVDGVMQEHFTTVSKPTPGALLHLCADLNLGNAPSSFFYGKIDQLKFYPTKITTSPMDVAFKPTDVSEALAYFDMNTIDAATMKIASKVGTFSIDVKDGALVPASGPWYPSQVIGTNPGITNLHGGQTVTVFGSNFAPSPFLKMQLFPPTSQPYLVSPSSMPVEKCCGAKPSTSVEFTAPAVSCDTPAGLEALVYATNSDFHVERGPSETAVVFSAESNDLAKGLIHYYPMLVNNGDTVVDVIGGPTSNFEYPEINAHPDMDLYENSAYQVDGSDDGSVDFQMPVEKSGAMTMCARIFIKYSNNETHKILVGGWKLLCSHATGANETVYVNGEALAQDSADADFYGTTARKLRTEGKADFEGFISGAWFWDRVLSSCEMRAKFVQGDAFALNMNDAAKPVSLSIGKLPQTLTLSTWVFPFYTNDYQTIFASAGGEIALGLVGDRVSFAVEVNCGGTCRSYREYASPKTTVIPQIWNHIAITYDGTKAFYYLNGVLLDYYSWEETHLVTRNLGSFHIGFESTSNLTHPVASAPQDERRFHGLVADISVSEGAKPAWFVQADNQCSPKNSKDFFAHAFFLGAGDTYTAFNAGVSGASGLAVPYAAYGSAFGPATTRYGTGANEFVKGTKSFGEFTITARDNCGLQRREGGDDFTVTMVDAMNALPLEGVEVVDTLDGNYHVKYDGICKTYETSISLGGVVFDTFTTTIKPGVTDAKSSAVVGFVDTCFGVPNVFTIQANDAFGCPKTDKSDTFKATILGPHVQNATVTPLGNGQYSVYWVPEQVGKYWITVTLETADGVSETIGGGNMTMTACAGHSGDFDGDTTLMVAENGYTGLDLASTTVTMSAWVVGGPAENKMGRIVYKGTSEESTLDSYTKTYQMYVDATQLCAEVYVGRGELRAVCTDKFVKDVWTHVAAVYSGDSFTIYLGGVFAASASFNGTKAVHANDYDHPLTVGHGFRGKVDNVILYTSALSAVEVKESMSCPGFNKPAGSVAAYISFNDEAGSTNLVGFGGAECAPHSSLSMSGGCMVGTMNGTLSTDQPYSEFQNPSSKYSKWAAETIEKYMSGFEYKVGSSDEWSIISVHDHCAYFYVAADESPLYTMSHPVDTSYEGDVCPEYPKHAIQDGIKADTRLVKEPDYTTVGNLYYATMAAKSAQIHHLKVHDAESDEFFAALVDGAQPVTVVAGEAATISIVSVPGANAIPGVPYSIAFSVLDKESNVLRDPKLKITATYIESSTSAVSSTSAAADAEAENWIAALVLPAKDTYTLTFAIEGVSNLQVVDAQGSDVTAGIQVQATDHSWLKLYTKNDNALISPTTRRFEHTAFVHGTDMYVWGGAASDKTYLNSLEKLSMADGFSAKKTMYYKKDIKLTTTSVIASQTTVEITVDTATLIQGGRMNTNCLDIMFKMPMNGNPLFYYVSQDPEHKCGTEKTTIYVSIPAYLFLGVDSMTIEMYYGDLYATSSSYNDPSKTFDIYDGFESGVASDKWVQDVGCGPADPSFSVAYGLEHAFGRFGRVLELTGSGKLQYNQSGLEYNQSGKAPGALATSPSSFKMSAFFYDDGSCKSAAYISPDYVTCPQTAVQKKPMLSDLNPLEARSTALGTYTLSTESKYAVSSPWQSTTQARAAGWHLLEVVSTPSAGMKAMVDGVTVKTSEAVNFYDLSITNGMGVGANYNAELGSATAIWDEVFVFSYVDAITAEVPSADEDTVVANVESRMWEAVAVSGSPPPPRYSHTSVVYGDSVYVFGGERSSYVFNDVWKLNLTSMSWSYVAPASEVVPPARFDHVAVVSGDAMIVMGGRDGSIIRSDMWSFDFTKSVWTEVTASTAAGGVFGHSGSLVGDSLMVFGGYTATGFSGGFYSCSVADGQCVDLTNSPCMASGNTPKDVGLLPRYSHGSVEYNGKYIVYGGSNVDGAYGQVFEYNPAECTWKQLPISTPLPRYEMAVGVMAGGMYVHGGHDHSGSFTDDVFYLPL